jgi:DNA replicative helicase MCM subunit Mcm2 (Cdc46/Mcm family)
MGDVESAKKVFITSLKDVGIDMETGKLDAGIVNCGKSQSQAKKIKLLTVS